MDFLIHVKISKVNSPGGMRNLVLHTRYSHIRVFLCTREFFGISRYTKQAADPSLNQLPIPIHQISNF